jgi:hypothetical protein
MAAWRAGVSLMVLVRGLTCDCSPKGAQHLRTIEILQVDTVKKAVGHIDLSARPPDTGSSRNETPDCQNAS